MIIGMHAVVFTQDAAADRAFFRDVLELESVDVGDGWLVFAAPPTEVAFHPADGSSHELYLMTDDLERELARLRDRGVTVAEEVHDEGWGILGSITLPGGGTLAIYQPRHATAF